MWSWTPVNRLIGYRLTGGTDTVLGRSRIVGIDSLWQIQFNSFLIIIHAYPKNCYMYMYFCQDCAALLIYRAGPVVWQRVVWKTCNWWFRYFAQLPYKFCHNFISPGRQRNDVNQCQPNPIVWPPAQPCICVLRWYAMVLYYALRGVILKGDSWSLCVADLSDFKLNTAMFSSWF